MKKIIFLLTGVLLIGLSHAQVGINTKTPLGTFHIDPQNDTNTTGTVGTSDDIIITPDGKMGVGTLNPMANFDVNGKIRIADGSEQDGYTFVADANGVGSWKSLLSPLSLAMDGLDATSNNIYLVPANNSQLGTEIWFYTKSYIDVNPGKQLIAAAFYTALDGDGVGLPPSYFYFATYSLSTSPSAFIAPEYILNSGGGRFVTLSNNGPNGSAGNSGYWAVNNPTAISIRLFIWVKVYFSTNVNAPNTYFRELASNRWWENIINISPIEEDF
ncbi:hypothetical protein [Dysgonomonas sp. GY617]|uniref:hypothetical protein n=1 Tax=Dysgonomonas sp. GY617 TaxID=2780420 RepID=UPI0018833DF7|nr:hypothetical protein [Dysgonomonas sp. GY617]MBF0577218.1 hypothetical protein [Dysgonomonas sp. GY617]